MPVRIKICGITNFEDAKVAANLGVDALGFIFFKKSPRYIHPSSAGEIIRKLPPFVAKVGVFVDESAETISEIVRIAHIDTIQLHGAESPQFCARMPLPVIKSFAVKPGFDVAQLSDYQVSGHLLDTWNESLKGGVGSIFDWSIAKEAVRRSPHLILAGGLGPSNIKEALESVRPFAVDINSGVEIKPGVKNPHKMREVVSIVKGWK